MPEVLVRVQTDYEKFVELFYKSSHIDLSLYQQGQMQRRILAFRDRHGFRKLCDLHMEMVKSTELFNRFLDHLTINVTEFYRNSRYWEALEKRIMPQLLSKEGKLKCWSAACSTGEEPYTIAMVLSKFMKLSEIRILATDLDQKALSAAMIGRYAPASIKEVPKPLLQKFFIPQGDHYLLSEEVKRCIQFKKQDLLADSFDQGFDLIVCRNVVIYFTEKAKDDLYAKFSRSLKKGGYLFVGCTEQIHNPGRFGFEPVETFFYRKK